jgi:hypothetical protein
MRVSLCHPDRKHYAKGLCEPCYMKPHRENWRSHNLDRHRKMCRDWAAQNRNRIRDNELKREFGITPEQYDNILASQNGHCLFCDKTPSGYKNLIVDHNHSTDEIRGLVCAYHNVTIAHIEAHRENLNHFLSYIDTSLGVSLPATSRYLKKDQ